jgi:hypothetical protein
MEFHVPGAAYKISLEHQKKLSKMQALFSDSDDPQKHGPFFICFVMCGPFLLNSLFSDLIKK